MKTMQDRIREFWDRHPCGTTRVDLPPESLEYFIEFDKYYQALYPYLLPFLDLESMKGKRVLEIGLGSGFTLQRIAGVARECLGMDISGETIKLNEARKQHFGLDLQLIQSSATSIPLEDDSIDVVVSIGCLHHIPQIQKAVDEIHRVLKPGGALLGMVYHRNSYRYRVHIPIARRLDPRWRGKTRQECVNEMYDGKGNPYGTVYSKAEVLKLLSGKYREIRFRVENFHGPEFLFLPRIIRTRIPRNLWLGTLGKVAGLDLYFTARAVKVSNLRR